MFDHATHREEWYAALELLGHRYYTEWRSLNMLSLCEHLIVTGAWWDIVDEVATRRVGFLLMHNRKKLTPAIRTWMVNTHLWRRRTAIICQLKHKSQTDLKLLTDAIDANIDDKDFFIRKGIGWALREYSKTNPVWVRDFVESRDNVISNLSRREGLKHIE